MTSTSGLGASNNAENTPQSRSCRKCNQRKTRCNKTQPCTSCVKLGIECIFPPPGRAPPRKKRALKGDLLSKVKSLEQKVRELENERNSSQSDASPFDEDASINTSPRHLIARSERASEPTASTEPGFNAHSGQFAVEDSSSRYVSHEALASFRDEVSTIASPTWSSTNYQARLERKASLPIQSQHVHTTMERLRGPIRIHFHSDIGLRLTHFVTCIQHPSSIRSCGVRMSQM